MADIHVVLVPVDGSEQSMQTVAYLGKFLSPAHTGIELFHVGTESPEPFFDLGELEDAAGFEKEIGQWRSGRTLHINQFMEKARALLLEAGFPSGHVSATVQPRRVGVARDIIHRAPLQYAAVAVGRQSRNILPLFMLGGVAAKLAEKIADLPLAIVGGSPEPRKAVVGMDRSLLARKGIVQLVRLMSRTLEDIQLCHVVRPLFQPRQDRESVFDSSHEARWLDSGSRKINPTMLYVKQLLTQAGMEPERLRTVILKEKTSRADGLCAEAEQAGAGTIIVGRRGTTVVDEFSMGRVTRKILYMAFDKAVWIV